MIGKHFITSFLFPVKHKMKFGGSKRNTYRKEGRKYFLFKDAQ